MINSVWMVLNVRQDKEGNPREKLAAIGSYDKTPDLPAIHPDKATVENMLEALQMNYPKEKFRLAEFIRSN